MATGDGTWQWINPSVQGNTIMGISFIDANTGWAVGSAGTVLKTADGGATWSPQIPSPNTCAGVTPYGNGCGLKGVSFIDASNGWVVGDYGTIWHTVTGGSSWTSQSLPGSGCGGGSCIYASLLGVHFIDSQVGVAVGPNYAFATRDGGASWQQVSGVSTSHSLNAVQMVSSTTAYAVGDSGVVYLITWNGATWSAVLQAGASTQNLYDVYFADAQHGLAVGGGRVWRTTDGTTWSQNSAARSESLRSVTMTGNTLVVTGGVQTVGENPGSSVILKRTSPGSWPGTWSDPIDAVAAGLTAASSNGTTDQLYTVAFPGGSSTGFAAGEAGGIVKTTDTGSNWALVAGGNAKKITGSSFINDTTGWMVAMDGSVMKTVNAGASWASDSSGIAAGTKLRAVSFINDTTGFAVGYSGRLFDATNAGVAYKYNGTSWSAMSLPAGVATLEAIHMTSATNGWAVGRAGASAPTGVALKTTDGSTWVFDGAGIGTDIKLYGVDATGASDGWAVGENSTSGNAVLLKYASGAPGSWTVTEKSDSTGFLGIDIVDGTTGYAVGYKSPSATPPYWQDSRIYKTGDGGTTWNTSLSTTYHNWFLSVAFINSTTGYVSGGSAGRVIKTTDGGTTWTPESVGAGWDLNTITVVPSTWAASGYAAFVGGDNAAALRSARPPEVESVNTAGVKVERSSTVSATFTKDLTPGTVTGTSFTVKRHSDSAPVTGTISFPSGNRTPVFTPASPLDYATQYDATFTTVVTDSSGNHLVENYDWSFSTSRDYWWTWYDNLSTGAQNWVLMANPSSAANNLTYKLSIGGVTQDLTQWNNGVAAPGASLTPQYPGVRNGPVNAASITGGYKGIVSQRVLWGQNSLEEVLGTDAEKLSNHFYWTWYDDLSSGYTNYVMVANPGTANVFYRVKVAGVSRSTGEILPGQSAFWRDGSLQGGPVEVEGCTVAFVPIDMTCGSPADVLASQRVLSNGDSAFNEVPGIPAADLSYRYVWTWYDNHTAGATDWIMIANQNAVDMSYEILIGGVIVQSDTDPGAGPIPPGGYVAPVFRAPDVPAATGPVEVRTYDATAPGLPHTTPMNSIASQRVVWGPSFEEVPGYPYSALTNTYHWTWYDQSQANVFNWVMVAKQDETSTTVYYKVLVGGVERKACTQISDADRDYASFPTIIGGPVEVRSYSDDTCTTPSAPGNGIMASQRVLWKGFFNETLGTVLN
ncbi:MAG: Ig-like domain-containing protein [Actinobacteria bacterium]|nr:Ig-like domain-containing protein [Actinomycetota bacterium]